MSELLVRPASPEDRDAALALADRLTIGVAPWRGGEAVLAAVRGWVAGSLAASGDERAVFVAEDRPGEIAGFVSVERSTHWSGEVQAHVGELVVAEAHEGRGVGRALMAAAEGWARERGHRILVLETGAANAGARAFYARLGYAEEDIRLAKTLDGE